MAVRQNPATIPVPPRLATWLLTRLLPHHSAEALTGDLTEAWQHDIRPHHAAWRASLWYWRQTLRALAGMTVTDATGALPPVGTSKTGGILPDVVADVRHAFRLIRRTPLFTATCVALFAIGIGTNATIILFLDSQVTHPIPGVPDGRTLFNIEFPRETLNPSEKPSLHGYLLADEWRLVDGHLGAFSMMAASTGRGSTVNIDNGQSVDAGDIEFVSPQYFDVLRPVMAIGPIPAPFADARNIVISYGYWRAHLASDPAAIGRTLTIRQMAFTIAGVTGPYFRGGSERFIDDGYEATAWIPASAALDFASPRLRASANASMYPDFNQIIGRLAPGASLERADAEVKAMARSLKARLHQRDVKYGYVEPVGTTMLARLGEMPRSVVALPILVLLVACSNVSILLLGRGVNRRREIAVRLATGASRPRVVRLLIVESVCLGTLGALGGILFAFYATRLLAGQYPQLFGTHEIAIGWRTVLGSLVLAVGTGVAFGVLPALQTTRTSLSSALKSAVSGEGRHRSALQRFFVITEMAISMGMVCVTGLVLTHIYPAFVAPPGLDISVHTLTTVLNFPTRDYSVNQIDTYLAAVRQRLLQHPEIETVSTVDRFPIGQRFYMTSPVSSGVPGSAGAVAGKVMIDPGYFAAMRIPLQSGHDFSDVDSPDSLPAVIVGSAIADRLWPGLSPIGRTLRVTGLLTGSFGSDTAKHFVTVVGVVTTHGLLDEDRMDGLIYFSRQQMRYEPSYMNSSLNLIIRTRSSGVPLIPVLQREIAAIDPAVALTGLRTTAEIHRAAYASTLAMATVGMVGGLITLLMACVGVYAVIAFGIGQRTREIGLRMALGARPGQVVRLFFLEGFHLAFSGFGLGVPLAIAWVMILEAGDKSPEFLSPLQVGGIVGLLLGVALLASWLPSRRAARIDPMRALQGE